VAERRYGGTGRRTAGRISRSAEFDRVYRQGRSVANRYLVLYTFPRVDGDAPRLGLSVGRKVGGAVERNRVKRLLRESFGETQANAWTGFDVVVVARPPARELAASEGLRGMQVAVAELLAKAGLRLASAAS
jgi:ribonuclease P protein component